MSLVKNLLCKVNSFLENIKNILGNKKEITKIEFYKL